MPKVNLRQLATDVTLAEGLKQSVSVAQVSEILGILGWRWRCMPTEKALAEFHAILERAGKMKGAEDKK